MKRFNTAVPTVSACAVALALCACTAGQTTAPPINSVNPGNPNYSKLQFAVGNATIALSSGPASVVGLNVVSTERQASGLAAFGVDTPSITGPFTFAVGAVPTVGGALPDPYNTIFTGFPTTNPNGPSLQETLGTPAITGTLQTLHPGAPPCDGMGAVPAGFTSCQSVGQPAPNTTTFGQSGGVFAMGLGPKNHAANTAQSYSYSPYPQPLYDEGFPHPRFLPVGGPPAFDPDGNGTGTRDGLVPAGVDSFGLPFLLGIPEGITVFEGVNAGGGQYTLNVRVDYLDASGHPQVVNFSQSAVLNKGIVLPIVSAPLVTPDGAGGATIAPIVLPAGTEGLIQIVDYGPGGGPANGNASNANCQGAKGTAFAPVYYTIHVTASGPVPALTNNHGPNIGSGPTITPSPSICTAAQNQTALGNPAAPADNITVLFIAFDYPLFQLAFAQTQPGTPQAPPIIGTAGQPDITISVQQEEDAPGYAQNPLSIVRMPMNHPRVAPGITLPITPDIARKFDIPLR